MGLLPAPEPKFKLSNFMRILGDQAVADPSKVEARVLKQVKQREIAHEMRNLAAKSTPSERREKKIRKAQEAEITSRQISVAAFAVKNLANLKHRFKVDLNAQQLYLSGIVVLCPEDGVNLVYVEGGPKGIRKFVRLMLHRIRWDEVNDETKIDALKTGDGNGNDDENGDSGSEGDDDNDDDDEDKAATGGVNGHSTPTENRCILLWQGTVAKRIFTGVKFQECRSTDGARRMLEDKHLGHLWGLATEGLAVNSADNVLDLV